MRLSRSISTRLRPPVRRARLVVLTGIVTLAVLSLSIVAASAQDEETFS